LKISKDKPLDVGFPSESGKMTPWHRNVELGSPNLRVIDYLGIELFGKEVLPSFNFLKLQTDAFPEAHNGSTVTSSSTLGVYQYKLEYKVPNNDSIGSYTLSNFRRESIKDSIRFC
jgi:hypothetical protein